MSDLSFESSKKRYSESVIPVYCYKINSGVLSDKLVTVTPNWHDEMEIICAEAEFTLYIGDKRYDADPKDVFFINPREIHYAFRKSYGPIRSIVFDLSLLKMIGENDEHNLLIDSIIEQKKKFITKVERDSELYREMMSFFKIIDECAYSRFELGAEKYKMLSGLYSMMAKCLEADHFEDSLEEKRSGMSYVTNLLEYIDNHYDEPLTVKYLAKKFKLSEPYLYSLFKEYVGISPLQHINSTRLRESYRLLEEGASVTDTAFATGFSDASYFIKFFKNATGQTPSKWKNKNKQGKLRNADKN
jgi:AraC-like DNA-binding protein